MMNAGGVIFDNLPMLFRHWLRRGLASESGIAALSAAVSVFCYQHHHQHRAEHHAENGLARAGNHAMVGRRRHAADGRLSAALICHYSRGFSVF